MYRDMSDDDDLDMSDDDNIEMSHASSSMGLDKRKRTHHEMSNVHNHIYHNIL
jgi:hypothetical protein